MRVVHVTLRDARRFVSEYHRHSDAPQGGIIAIGVVDDDEQLWGIAIIGRCVAPGIKDPHACELTRCCVRPDGPRNACSFLYGRAWRLATAMGFERMITYTLSKESGASLRGAGFKMVGESGSHKVKNPWGSSKRKRAWKPIYNEPKTIWEKRA